MTKPYRLQPMWNPPRFEKEKDGSLRVMKDGGHFLSVIKRENQYHITWPDGSPYDGAAENMRYPYDCRTSAKRAIRKFVLNHTPASNVPLISLRALVSYEREVYNRKPASLIRSHVRLVIVNAIPDRTDFQDPKFPVVYSTEEGRGFGIEWVNWSQILRWNTHRESIAVFHEQADKIADLAFPDGWTRFDGKANGDQWNRILNGGVPSASPLLWANQNETVAERREEPKLEVKEEVKQVVRDGAGNDAQERQAPKKKGGWLAMLSSVGGCFRIKADPPAYKVVKVPASVTTIEEVREQAEAYASRVVWVEGESKADTSLGSLEAQAKQAVSDLVSNRMEALAILAGNEASSRRIVIPRKVTNRTPYERASILAAEYVCEQIYLDALLAAHEEKEGMSRQMTKLRKESRYGK